VSDTATGCASYEPKSFVAPRIAGRRTLSSGHRHLVPVIVGPQRAVATTDRAVTARQPARPARDRDPNCTAMAGSCKHACCPDDSLAA
jgi:hypothetical protein